MGVDKGGEGEGYYRSLKKTMLYQEFLSRAKLHCICYEKSRFLLVGSLVMSMLCILLWLLRCLRGILGVSLADASPAHPDRNLWPSGFVKKRRFFPLSLLDADSKGSAKLRLKLLSGCFLRTGPSPAAKFLGLWAPPMISALM